MGLPQHRLKRKSAHGDDYVRVKIDELLIPSHAAPHTLDGSNATVTLALKDIAQDKDFLMRYRVTGGQLKPRPLPSNHLDPATAFLSVDATRRTTTQPSP